MYYLQSRYYNPEWGRFINADIIVGALGELLSFNMFAYCTNNPIVLSDEHGFRLMYCLDQNEESEEQREASLAVMNNVSRSNTLVNQQQQSNNSITYAKGGKSQPNSKFRGLPDEDIINGANDKSLPGFERREFQQELKFRGLRDVQKRKELYGGGNKSGRKSDSSFDETAAWGAAIYIIISEGSRIIFPARNLIPIP